MLLCRSYPALRANAAGRRYAWRRWARHRLGALLQNTHAPEDAASIGSRTLANLVMYLLDGDPDGETMTPQLPVQMREAIYAGMQDEASARGKEIRTKPDEHAT